MAGAQTPVLDFRNVSRAKTFTVYDYLGTLYTVEVDTPLVGVGLILEQADALERGTIGKEAYDDLCDTLHALLTRRTPTLTLREMKKRFTTSETIELVAYFFSQLRETVTPSETPDASPPTAPSETTPSMTPTRPRSPRTSRRAG